MGLFHHQKFQAPSRSLIRFEKAHRRNLLTRAHSFCVCRTAHETFSEQNRNRRKGNTIVAWPYEPGPLTKLAKAWRKLAKLAPKADHIPTRLPHWIALRAKPIPHGQSEIAIDLRPANRFHRATTKTLLSSEDPRFTELLYPEKDGYAG